MSTSKKSKKSRKYCPATPQLISPAVARKLIEGGGYDWDPESRYLIWAGKIQCRFNERQGLVVSVYWDNLLRGNRPMTEERILSVFDDGGSSVAEVLRRHPTYNTIFVGDKRGGHWMAIPPDALERCQPEVRLDAAEATVDSRRPSTNLSVVAKRK